MSERISTGKAAAICGLTRPTLLRLAKAGMVPGAAELAPRLWRFHEARLIQWVEQAKQRGVPLKYALDPEYDKSAPSLYEIRKTTNRLGMDYGIGDEFIYFIRAANGNIKIGKSKNPTKRVAVLRAANAIDLKLLGVIPGSLSVERLIHLRFAKYRIRVRSEWYRPAKALLQFIEESLREHGKTS